MWSYLLVLVFTGLVSSAIPPRKLFNLDQTEDTPIKPFVDPTDGISYRLPNDTYPRHYDVSLKTEIHSGDFSFTGKVEILFEVLVPTMRITLQQRQLTIIKVDLFDFGGISLQDDIDFTEDPLTEFLVIQPPRFLTKGDQYRLRIYFSGTLRNDDAGFYRSSYVNAQGQTVWLATTQFQATDARHGFPCWDEPGIRSTFAIQIEHHQSYTALSNMPAISQVLTNDDHIITKFATTPKIQTYLIAYVVSDFVSVDDLEAKTPQRVFATHAQIADGQGDFALDFGVKNLEAFEKYLGIDYLLPKLDQISIPDFSAGAMENFGLVTYREDYLLYNNVTHTAVRKFDVAETVSHEYAHQWFGNHVSPAWWSYLWVNEGFATLFESYATGLVYPDWREMEIFVVLTVHAVFQSDSLNPRAMTHYVESPENIDNLFDNVAYWKSGAVLRMLQTLMTEEVFAKGLQIYLDEFVERAATPADLYRSLQTAIDGELLEQTPNIAAFMRTWELQAGFPVITVIKDGDVIMIEQERYFLDPEAGHDDTSIWSIPLNYMVASNPDYSKTTMDFWMTQKSYTLTNAEARKKWTAGDWVLFNIQETGFYRVNYDMNLWKLLSDEMSLGDHTKIHPTNRAQLIDDSFNLARTERLSYSVPLDFLKYLKLEDDYIPWVAANRALNFLRPFLIASEFYDHFESLMMFASNLIFNRLGSTSKPTDIFLDKFARNIAINWACSTGNVVCLAETTAQMNQVAQNELSIEPDLETVIYCNGLRQAPSETFHAIWISAFYPQNEDKKLLILRSLGCSHNGNLLKSYLESSVDQSFEYNAFERQQIIVAVYSNGGLLGLNLVLEFLYDKNLSILEGTFGASRLTSIATSLAGRVVNTYHHYQLITFMSNLAIQQFIPIDRYLENIRIATARITWIYDNVPSIETWMRLNVIRVPPTLPPQVGIVTEPTVLSN